jgi:hypothetical protein
MKWIALAICLASCTPAPELAPDLRAAGAAVRQAWGSAGLPAPDQGRCDVGTFHVRTPDVAEYERDCRGVYLHSYGCLVWTTTDAWFRYKTQPVVVVSPWWRAEPNIVIHELMHAYTRCAGLRPGQDPGDSQHTDVRVWSGAGGADSVEARARSMM